MTGPLKVEGQTQSLVFGGIKIDMVNAVLELPSGKVVEFHGLIKETLLFYLLETATGIGRQAELGNHSCAGR